MTKEKKIGTPIRFLYFFLCPKLWGKGVAQDSLKKSMLISLPLFLGANTIARWGSLIAIGKSVLVLSAIAGVVFLLYHFLLTRLGSKLKIGQTLSVYAQAVGFASVFFLIVPNYFWWLLISWMTIPLSYGHSKFGRSMIAIWGAMFIPFFLFGMYSLYILWTGNII